jgi:ABC-type transporter MlaC component
MAVPFGASAASALTPQEQHVSTLAKDVMALARSGQRGTRLHNSVARMLHKHSSISSVARFALGPYSRKLPAARKTEYYKLVEKYVATLFSEYVGDFAGTGVEIEKSSRSGKFVIVDSRILSANTKLRWRVYSNGNSHRITDVNFRGIWLSIRMRDQFVNVLKNSNGDFDALINYLRTNS